MADHAPDPRQIAERGTEIYQRRYRSDYESKWRGRFVAIDVNTEQAYVADFSEEALAKARAAAPHGVFFLIRIGFLGAFKISTLSHAADRGL